MARDRERREEPISSQGMLDHAPSQGNRDTYLKLPKGVKLFMPKRDILYRLVFLPWKAGKGNPAAAPGTWTSNRFIPVHKGVGPNEESFICSAKAFGRRCACCEAFQAARKIKGARWEDIKEMRYKDREMFLIHNLEGEKDNLFVWEESVHLFGNHFRSKIEMKPSRRFFADFKEGMIIEVMGKEKKIQASSCTEFASIEFEKRDEPLSETLISKAAKVCLDDCLIEAPYEKLRKLVGLSADADSDGDGEEPETNTEDEEEEEPEPSEDEDQDEDEEEPEEPSETEDEDEDEEEPEETEDEEEVEEEEPEDEDEEPPPPKKKKVPAKKTGKK